MKTRDVSMLIVEDDPTLLRGLKDAFSSAGYGIRVAIDGDSAVTMALEEAPDIMLLDLMLPGFDGFEVCEMVREDQPDLPILIVSARGKEEDIVRGLEAGADDFIIKPFSIAELRARVKAALRRTRGLGPGIFRFGEFQLDPGSRTLTHDGKEVGLTEQE
ncbi:MAG: response regulator transcription factor, partial [Verrucomicrobiota bacterium]